MRKGFPALAILLAIAMALPSPASGQKGKPAATVIIGFNGGDNPDIIRAKAGALCGFVAGRSGLDCQPFIAESYSHLIRTIAEGKVAFAFLSPLGFITAEEVAGAQVLLKAVRGGQPFYWSVILVRKDSGLRGLDDLKGKRFAFTHQGSTSGYVVPLSCLLEKGIEPERYFGEVVYAGGHQGVIRQVLEGTVDAGATFADDPQGKTGAWTDEDFVSREDAAQLRPIFFFSSRIPGDTFSAAPGLRESSPEIVEAVTAALVAMGESQAGQAVLRELYNIDTLMPAASEDYATVREAFKRVRAR